MSSLTVTKPTKEQIKQYPREYALFTQLDKQQDGKIDADELLEFARKVGSPEGVVKIGSFCGGEVSFEQLVNALRRSGEPVNEGQGNAVGYAARDKSGIMSPWKFERRTPKPDDVVIQITHCGICHSDLHQLKNEWGNSMYPMVAGHEIVGVITDVGNNVSNFKVGDYAGVGCLVDSCRQCEECQKGEEQYCAGGMTGTYNAKDKEGKTTYGGYSTHLVVDKNYTLKVPRNLDLAGAAPLLCAGITVYSPLKYYGLDKPGQHIAVVGLGGLGHMAVKFAKAFGATVTVISTSPNKEKEAREILGADHFLISKDEEQMKSAMKTMHGIVDTVSAKHALDPYLALLKSDGKYVTVGAPAEPIEYNAFNLIMNRKLIGGSLIGGIKETQDMLDFCGEHNIVCTIEEIPVQYVNTAMERLEKQDVKYRFVLDIQGSLIYA